MTQVSNIDLILYYSENEEFLPEHKVRYIEEVLQLDTTPPVHVENSGWISEGKVDVREDVYYLPDKNVYYKLFQTRSGDYFSDYEYYEPNIYEVVPKEKVITVYEKKTVTAAYGNK